MYYTVSYYQLYSHTAKQNYTFYERDYMYRASLLYRFVLTAAQRQPSKTIHFMSEIIYRASVLYRFVLPAAHRQPSKTIHFMSEIIIYSVCVYYTGVYFQLHTDNQVKLYIL